MSATIERQDGVTFVVRPYRELIATQNKELLKRELEFLAKDHGDFCALLPLAKSGFEAIFSREPGYLLGETVQYFFENEPNLIFCEALSDNRGILLVVIQQGTILLDGLVEAVHLHEELIPILTSSEKFRVVIHGSVPFSKEPEENHFSLEPNQIFSFDIAPDSIFDQLPARDEFKLISIEDVFASARFAAKNQKALIIGVFLAVMGLYFGWGFIRDFFQEPTQVEQREVDPYAQYVSTLETPSPSSQTQIILQDLQLAYSLAGWTVTNLAFADNNVRFKLANLGGSVNFLRDWATEKNISYSLQNDGASIFISHQLTARPQPKYVMRLDKCIAEIFDRINNILPQRSVSLGQETSKGAYKEQKISITYQNISPETLILITDALADLPVMLIEVDAGVANGAILSGKMDLLVLGN